MLNQTKILLNTMENITEIIAVLTYLRFEHLHRNEVQNVSKTCKKTAILLKYTWMNAFVILILGFLLRGCVRITPNPFPFLPSMLANRKKDEVLPAMVHSKTSTR